MRLCRLLAACARSGHAHAFAAAAARPAAQPRPCGVGPGQRLRGSRASSSRAAAAAPPTAGAEPPPGLSAAIPERCPGCGVRLQDEDEDKPGRAPPGCSAVAAGVAR